jgi:tetratricopeptide (TPR) repeat protein
VTKTFFVVLWALLLFASCAGTVQTPIKDATGLPASRGTDVVEIGSTNESDPSDSETHSSLSPDLLYLLLSGEIAGQRGEFTVALDNYLEAARMTRDARVAERAVQIALFVENNAKALEAVKIWVAAEPNSVSARKAASLLFLEAGESGQALEQIKAWLALEEKDFEKTVFAIAKLLDKQASHQALAIMSGLVRTFPDQAELHYAYAGLALERNQFQVAIDEVHKARALRPKWHRALLLQAQITMKMGDERSARRLRLLYAQYLVKAGSYALAEKQFERIVAEQPENHDALFALALVRVQLKRDTSADELLKRLLADPKWKDQASLYLGRMAAQRGRTDAALRWFDQVGPGALALEAGLSAVSVAASHGHLSDAYRRLRALRVRFPDEKLRMYLIEAEILNESEDYQGAFSLLTTALAEMPGRSELLYSRALTAERLGRLDVLEADLKAILKENPNDANALNALGYTLANRTQRFEESGRYLERAIELRPDDPVVIDSYGWLQYRLGHYQEALIHLQRAYRLEPDPEIAAHLGEVLWMMGKRAEAKSLWQEVLEKEPGNEYIHRVRIRLMGADID